MATSPSGKARDCKSRIPGSIPGVASFGQGNHTMKSPSWTAEEQNWAKALARVLKRMPAGLTLVTHASAGSLRVQRTGAKTVADPKTSIYSPWDRTCRSDVLVEIDCDICADDAPLLEDEDEDEDIE